MQHNTLKIYSLKNVATQINQSNNTSSQFADFESALDNLEHKSEFEKVKTIESDTGSPTFSVTSNSFQKPKTLKIFKTTSTNLPGHSLTKTKWNSVAFHTIPIIGNTDGKNEKSASSDFIQESKSASLSSFLNKYSQALNSSLFVSRLYEVHIFKKMMFLN